MRLATTHTYQTPTVRERVRCGHRVHVGPSASCQQAAYDPAGRPTPTAGGRRGWEAGCWVRSQGGRLTDGCAGGGSGCGCPRVLRPGDLVLVGEQHAGNNMR